MSGGSHNYICFRIEEDLVGKMHDRELDALMADVAKLAHAVEWWESGDTDEDDYRKAVSSFKKNGSVVFAMTGSRITSMRPSTI